MAEQDRNQKVKEITQRYQEKALFEEPQDRYGIYQLREGREGADYRFMGMAYLQEKGMAVNGADYRFVYGDGLQEEDTLESLYEKFNVDHPADYTGHSLSVSDVVVLKKGGELNAYYVDSFGFQELPEFVEQRKEVQEIQEEKEYPPLYLSDLSYAVEHGNVDAYLDSRLLNLDCRKAIETAIDEHFDGYHLAVDAAAGVVETYGTERVSFVLACTVQHLNYDGRFSKETKEWADSFQLPENISGGMDFNADYVVTSHPEVLDGFIDLAREEMEAHGREEEKQAGQINLEPFIKQFYVVNDAYGNKADREYQYFDTLEEALGAYHRLPNHLDKQIGMESQESVPSRMSLICCKNGIDEIEDIEKASLSGKWVNPEVADAVNRAVSYLDSRDMEAAYSLTDMKQYFFIQTTDEGYDYTFYDADYREIDGGIYDNIDVSEQEAIEDILSGEAGGKEVSYKVVELEKFLDEVEKAQELAAKGKEPSIRFYVVECMEFPMMGEYHENLTLAEAFEKYQEIPAERINGIKGIGFRLEDGSMYNGNYELMRAGVISKEAIDLVPHYKESPLVQKAMADLEEMLAKEKQREKLSGVRQSVLAALRERQAKQKSQEQQEQKEGEKAEKTAQGRRKGELEL